MGKNKDIKTEKGYNRNRNQNGDLKKINKNNKEREFVNFNNRISQKNNNIFYIKGLKGVLYLVNVFMICSKYNDANAFITSLFITLVSFGISFLEKIRDYRYEDTIVTQIGYIYPMLITFLLTILQIIGIINLKDLFKENWKYVSHVLVISLYIFIFLDFGFKPYKKGEKKWISC